MTHKSRQPSSRLVMKATVGWDGNFFKLPPRLPSGIKRFDLVFELPVEINSRT